MRRRLAFTLYLVCLFCMLRAEASESGGTQPAAALADYAAALLGALDHRQCRTVLDRARRVVALELDQHDVGGLPGQTLQAHQRRVADGVGEGDRLHARILRERDGRAAFEDHEGHDHPGLVGERQMRRRDAKRIEPRLHRSTEDQPRP